MLLSTASFAKHLSFILCKDQYFFVNYLLNLLFLRYGILFLKHISEDTTEDNISPVFSGENLLFGNINSVCCHCFFFSVILLKLLPE